MLGQGGRGDGDDGAGDQPRQMQIQPLATGGVEALIRECGHAVQPLADRTQREAAPCLTKWCRQIRRRCAWRRHARWVCDLAHSRPWPALRLRRRQEEHTSELQSLMRSSYADL